MPTTPPDLGVRPFEVDADVPRLVQLLQDAEAVDRSGTLVSEENVLLYLSVPHHNPLTDRWVIPDPQDPARLAAYAAVNLPAPGDDRKVADGAVVVHPAWRRQGLGTRLLSLMEGRLEHDAGEPPPLRVYLDPDLGAAVGFAHAGGFELSSTDTYTEMRASVNEVTAEVALPEGFSLRSYREVNHLPTLVEALNHGYAGLLGHHQTSVEEFAPWLDSLDHDGFFILFGPDGRAAGTGGASLSLDRTARNGVPTGLADSPGVALEYRSLDLYKTLLGAEIAHLRRLDMVRAELESRGDAPEVLAHYQALGFKVMRREVASHGEAHLRKAVQE